MSYKELIFVSRENQYKKGWKHTPNTLSLNSRSLSVFYINSYLLVCLVNCTRHCRMFVCFLFMQDIWMIYRDEQIGTCIIKCKEYMQFEGSKIEYQRLSGTI